MTFDQITAIIDFLGDNMTEEQASDLMDKAKESLSISEIETLYYQEPYGLAFYTGLSMYDGEMGGLSRY